MAIWWNGDEHSDDENFRWTWLRAVEWCAWPLFVSQPIAPFLLVLNPRRQAAWRIIVAVVVATWLWKLVRYHWISPRLADAGCWFVHLKWLSSFGGGVSLLALHRYWFAGLAGLWPLVTLSLMPVCGGGKVGVIQKQFLLQLGYVPLSGRWENCLIANFYRPTTSSDSRSAGLDQRYVDRILRQGIVFSLLWLMGVGSVIAVTNGLRAHRLITSSKGYLAGMRRAWCCLIVGGIGLTIWIPVVGIGIVDAIFKSPITQPLKANAVTGEASNGWYLIIPPVVDRSPRVDPHATFDRWNTMDVFDSVTDCQKARSQMRSLNADDLPINPKAYYLGSRPRDPVQGQEWDKRLALLNTSLADSLHDAGCIASDDPRLKGH